MAKDNIDAQESAESSSSSTEYGNGTDTTGAQEQATRYEQREIAVELQAASAKKLNPRTITVFNTEKDEALGAQDISDKTLVTVPLPHCDDILSNINTIAEVNTSINSIVSEIMLNVFFEINPELDQTYKTALQREINLNHQLIRDAHSNKEVTKKRVKQTSVTHTAETNITWKSDDNILYTPILSLIMPCYSQLMTDSLSPINKNVLYPHSKTHCPTTAKGDHFAQVKKHNKNTIWGPEIAEMFEFIGTPTLHAIHDTLKDNHTFNLHYHAIAQLNNTLDKDSIFKSWAESWLNIYPHATYLLGATWEAFQKFFQENLAARNEIAKEILMQALYHDPNLCDILLPYIFMCMTTQEVTQYFDDNPNLPLKTDIAPAATLVDNLTNNMDYSYRHAFSPSACSVVGGTSQTKWARANSFAEAAIVKAENLEQLMAVTSIIRTAIILNPHKNPGAKEFKEDVYSKTRQKLMKMARERIVELATDNFKVKSLDVLKKKITLLERVCESPLVTEFRIERSKMFQSKETTTVQKLKEEIARLQSAASIMENDRKKSFEQSFL